MSKEAMKLGLEALKRLWLLGDHVGTIANPAIKALEEALAKQAPVAVDITIDDDDALSYLRDMVVQSDGDLTPIRLLVGEWHSGYGLYIASADYPEEGAVKIADVAANKFDTTPQANPLTNAVTVAGLQASIGILSRLVDVQQQLLIEVEDVCGRDGHGGQLEDGESDLIDRVRAQIAAIAAPTPQPKQEQGEVQHEKK